VIHRVGLRRFKRFGDVEFILPGHVVLAGPNNTGKTTVLQAIAAWSLALNRWRELNDFQRHRGYYTKAPIARQAFSAVPLRAFDLLWREREYTGSLEIEIQSAVAGWTVAMELIADSTEQIYVRPLPTAAPDVVRNARLTTAFVPAMSGLGTEEPLYQRPKVDQLLGQASRATSCVTCWWRQPAQRRPGPGFRNPSGGSLGASWHLPTPRVRTSWQSTASTRADQLSTSPARAAGSSRC
jgi:hypothetical protein